MAASTLLGDPPRRAFLKGGTLYALVVTTESPAIACGGEPTPESKRSWPRSVFEWADVVIEGNLVSVDEIAPRPGVYSSLRNEILTFKVAKVLKGTHDPATLNAIVSERPGRWSRRVGESFVAALKLMRSASRLEPDPLYLASWNSCFGYRMWHARSVIAREIRQIAREAAQ